MKDNHIRYRYGICLNDSCEKCKNKEVQEIPVRKDFVCQNPECGKKLRECPPPKKGGSKGLLFAILGVVGIALIGLIVWSLASDVVPEGGNPDIGTFDTIPTQEEIVNITAVNVDSIALAKADSIIAAKDITDSIHAKARADSIKLAQADSIIQASRNQEANAPVSIAKATTATPSSYNGKLRLSYGVYIGDVKNGYPDGMGRLTYSTSRQINRFDSKGRMAQTGDYVVGEFVRGFLVQGKHYNSNGELVETLMIGVPASNTFDQK